MRHLAFTIVLLSPSAFAQDGVFTIDLGLGSFMTDVHHWPEIGVLASTQSNVYQFPPNGIIFTPLRSAPLEARITATGVVGDDQVGILCTPNFFGAADLLGQDGFTYYFRSFPKAAQRPASLATAGPQNFLTFVGDTVLFALSTNNVFRSTDDGHSWSADTSGLNGSFLSDITVASSGTAFVATDKGLYARHPDSSRWNRVDSLYVDYGYTTAYPYMRSVWTDRNGILFASPWTLPRGVFKSTNEGASWTYSDQGIENLGVAFFGDDRFGNLYLGCGAFGNTDRLYKSTDLGESWTRIDSQLTSRLHPGSSGGLFNDIVGDSLVHVATVYGHFYSSDQGSTWIENNGGIADEAPLGFVKLSSGRGVYSGSLGIFTNDDGTPVWTKRHPVDGYKKFDALTAVGENIFALGESIVNQYGQTLSSRTVVRSTDFGETWQYDTSGGTDLEWQYWYVDEFGTQHVGGRWYSYLQNPMMYVKPLGGTWEADTAGLMPSGSLDQPRAIFSDKAGNLFVSTESETTLWRRPVGGGLWTRDTAGLVLADPIMMGTAGPNGTAYAATSLSPNNPSTLYKRTGGTWSTMPLPPERNADNIDAISVDSSGTLWIAFSSFYWYVGTGVYSTTDDGSTWMDHGLDSVTMNFNSQYLGTYGLVSYGDTTYALSRVRGMYGLTHTGGTSAVGSSEDVPGTFTLEQNFPNPFNPMTVIRYQMPEARRARLGIHDLLGREVAVLVDAEKQAGGHSVTWDASAFPSGVYFCRLSTGGTQLTKKLVLMR